MAVSSPTSLQRLGAPRQPTPGASVASSDDEFVMVYDTKEEHGSDEVSGWGYALIRHWVSGVLPGGTTMRDWVGG